MFKKIFTNLIIVSLLNLGTSSVLAIELDEATRTIPATSDGKTIVLTPEQVKRGKRLFNSSCGQCHVGGITKTNPNLGLDTEALS
ncbi:unnamed protein product, partial [Ectocarpus sp. 4 AP-2014]